MSHDFVGANVLSPRKRPLLTWSGLLAVTAAATLLWACGGAPETTGAPTDNVPAAPADPSGDPLEYALAFATAQQHEALADGVITPAEFEQATLAMVQCMMDEGIDFEQMPEWDETNTRMDFIFVAGKTIEETFVTTAQRDECHLRHRGAVGQVWQRQQEPSETKLIEARASLAACLREAGLEVPENPSPSEITAFADREAFWPCAENVQIEFSIPGFAG